MKRRIAINQDTWLHSDENLQQWENGLSASERRILITKWVADAWEYITQHMPDTLQKYFIKTGSLITTDATMDDQVHPQGFRCVQTDYRGPQKGACACFHPSVAKSCSPPFMIADESLPVLPLCGCATEEAWQASTVEWMFCSSDSTCAADPVSVYTLAASAPVSEPPASEYVTEEEEAAFIELIRSESHQLPREVNLKPTEEAEDMEQEDVDYDDDAEISIEEAILCGTAPELAPPAQQGRALVSRHILLKWEHLGWAVGKVLSYNPKRTALPYTIYWECDDARTDALLSAAQYLEVGSEVELEHTAEHAPAGAWLLLKTTDP